MTKAFESINASNMPVPAGIQAQAVHVRNDTYTQNQTDYVCEEVAVALVYNGISHAVMMATPCDLEDFAIGFTLSEAITESAAQIYDVEAKEHELGWQIDISIATEQFANLKNKRRQLTGRTGCGLCGLDSLEQAIPKNIAKVGPAALPTVAAINSAVIGLDLGQELKGYCGSVHAAALADGNGNILLIREDVGRHNALDKLIGAIETANISHQSDYFVTISSRASYEMVYKLARKGIASLVAVSAPTSLAIAVAEQANMNLVGFVRKERHNIYCQQY